MVESIEYFIRCNNNDPFMLFLSSFFFNGYYYIAVSIQKVNCCAIGYNYVFFLHIPARYEDYGHPKTDTNANNVDTDNVDAQRL